MIRIEVGDKKEALFYGIALGCVLFLVIGVTVLYWAPQGNGQSHAYRGSQSTASQSGKEITSTNERGEAQHARASVSRRSAEINERNGSWLFFGTVIVALLLLFCLTFRYYTRREIQQTEKRWRNACEDFLNRIEVQRLESGDKFQMQDAPWAKILRGEL
jgi:hypothetical protein